MYFRYFKTYFSGQDPGVAFDEIHKTLLKSYPGHILEHGKLEWMFMNAGGWMGAVCILHASVTEYVLFFGTAIETQGHSGTYIIYLGKMATYIQAFIQCVKVLF